MKIMKNIFITECPRDAIQGISTFIPTTQKVEFIKALCKVGFDVLDMGSFVSAKAVPQLQDTHEVLKMLDKNDKENTQFLCIVANTKGAELAAQEELVDIIGFPFSISEEFQLRNTNSTREKSLETVKEILHISKNKKVRIYLSMAFGNPYQEFWNIDILLYWAKKLVDLGVKELALSDTIGNADIEKIHQIFYLFKTHFPSIIVSAHFHSNPETATKKINAAHQAGCNHFDVAINGKGGCPFAKDELVGNISTQQFLALIPSEKINNTALQNAISIANTLYNIYH
jgi:hydroxymethylglutaryl-CoA lyase